MFLTTSALLSTRDTVAIDSVHLEPAFYVDTRVRFDRAFRQVVRDAKLGHDIYALEKPLQPGDSLTLSFDVKDMSLVKIDASADGISMEEGATMDLKIKMVRQ